MSKPQTIVRAKHDKQNPYFQMRRDTAQDETLSWEARGLLCYLLSKPDDWEIDIKDLQQNCGQGRVYRIINELKDAGYIKDRTKQQNSETGRWEWTPYYVYETPQADKIIHITETVSRKPQHGNPDTENREIKQKTEEQNTETNNIADKPQDAPPAVKAKKDKQPKPAEVLGKVFGVPPITGSDWSLYGKVCNQLSEAGITLDEYSDYVSWVRRLAKTSGGWKVTIPSLISNGRVSDYIATKALSQERKVTDLKQQDQEEAEMLMYQLLTGGQSA